MVSLHPLRLLPAALLMASLACRPSAESSCREVEAQGVELYESGELIPARDLVTKTLSSAKGNCRWRLKTLLADIQVLLRQNKEALYLLEAEPFPADADAAARYRFHLAKGYARGDSAELKEARQIAASVSNARWQVDALLRLANLERRRNRDEAAEALYREAVTVADRSPDEHASAEAHLGLGFYLFRQERLAESESTLQRALALADKLKLPIVGMRSRGNLGAVYMRWGDYARALDLITRAEQTARQKGLRSDQVLLLQNLGNIQYMLGQPQTAGSYLEQSRKLAQEGNDLAGEAVILYNLSLVQIENGNISEAAKSIEKFYEIRKTLKDPNALISYRFRKAQLDRAQRNLGGARQLLQSLLRERQLHPWFAWSLHGELAAVCEQARDYSCADFHYEKAIEIMHEARDEIRSVASQLAFTSGNIGLHQQYVRFLAGRGESERALRAADWGRTAGPESKAMPSFTQSQVRRECARRNAILIAYSLGARQSYGWIFTPSRSEMVVLPKEADIRAAVERFEREMDGSPPVTAAAKELYDMLVAPMLRPAEQGGTVWMAPDGVLHRINPEAFFTGGRYWLEQGSVMRISSVAAFTNGTGERRGEGKMLVIGDPVPPAVQFPELPGAKEEIGDISGYFSATVLRGVEATPRAYLEGHPEAYDYVHFSAHSVASTYEPMESALILSRAGDGFELKARQIAGHPIRARLVMLASCRSAGERLSSGGLLGLGFAFLQAGAGTVITSLRDIDDGAARQFVREFYRRLAKGESVEQGMKEAKLSLLRGGVYVSPRHWASWVGMAGRAR